MKTLFFVLGLLSAATGTYAALHFNPPAYADPGAVNACWLTFALLVIVGVAYMAAPLVGRRK